jgi:hypothetical protein
VGLKLNGTHQLLVYADDVNLLGDSVDTIKKNTQTLIDASKEVGLEVNTEKTKCMSLPLHQKTGGNHDIKTANRCKNDSINRRHNKMYLFISLIFLSHKDHHQAFLIHEYNSHCRLLIWIHISASRSCDIIQELASIFVIDMLE